MSARSNQVGPWLYRWRHLLAYVFIGAGAVWGFAESRRSREADLHSFENQARIERESNVGICESGNERTRVLAEFMRGVLKEPDPRQYDFIADPQLRQGAIDEARRRTAELRQRVEITFKERDCGAQYPLVTTTTR